MRGSSVHSVYKPVPPPKPFSGAPPAAAAGNSSNSGNSGEDQLQQQAIPSLKDQLAAITGATIQSGPPPPLLPHILVTDQGHFHTHSTKFPIEIKEGGINLPSTSSSILTPSSASHGTSVLASSVGPPAFSGSATLGRGSRGVSGWAGMGVAKGSTLPRSRPPPHTTHTHQTHTHHATGVNGGEEKDQLLSGERHQRYIDGIDNPALLDDTHMGTLAGVLPSSHPSQPRPYESPFLSRHSYRPSTLQQHQNTSQQLPVTSQHHQVTSQHHPSSAQQATFSRETWMRGSQGQFAGIVEIHPPQGHIHMNGHVSQHHSATPAGHIPNGSAHNHVNNHMEGPHSHTNGHHSHPNSHQDPVNSFNSQSNNRTAGTIDENHVNDAQEQRDDPRKDEKWGSLTRGLAARKYQHLKEKLSSKFSRGDKPEDRTITPQADGKNTASQGTNTSSGNTNNSSGNSQQETNGIQPGPSRDSGRVNKLNTSFRKAIHQSSQKTNLQENIMETSLSASQELGGSSQQVNGLPPHYPRSSSQYHTQQQTHTAAALSPPTHRAPAPLPMSSPQLGRRHQHDPMGHGLANRRSGSYHHLAQLRQEPPSWRPHHYSVDNLVDAHALPSDHTYSGPAVSSGRGQPAGGEGVGSGGSDSGRGTAGSGGEGRVPNTLDTSLDSSASQRQNNQGHSSGNDSEWVDMTDAELQRIMKKGSEGKSSGGCLVRRESLAATPPLPPLSPEATPQPSPQPSPPRHRKYSLSYSNGLNKPDLLEAAGRDGGKRGGHEGRTGNHSQESSQSTPRRGGTSHTQHVHGSNKVTSAGGSSSHRSLGALASGWSHRKEDERQRNNAFDPLNKNKNRVNIGLSGGDLDTGDITSTTDALDLDSMLDGVTEATTDDDATSAYDPDVHLIRKQLEGLEGMYSEVLKLLGGGRRGGGRHILGHGGGMGDLKTSRRRLHGSLSSLPSSIVSSRPGRDKRHRVIDDRVRKTARDGGGKSIHKRFQRLESHVVTLARSEIESIRGELATLKAGGSGGGGNSNRSGGHISWESFRAGIPGLSNPGRVKKLTQFFGDEPPLVRIFLRKLGYESVESDFLLWFLSYFMQNGVHYPNPSLLFLH
ncbi:hypothetical protein Hamer_G003728 [Homarus americanus]|uniref:Uncharacterized protein n=1 Tax=Homarus americanus TaxID=6706 RepID=A0A8J5NEX0_HOMAM|nr:hypothetical protein Hamer_G003728 [Homarus americanus]